MTTDDERAAYYGAWNRSTHETDIYHNEDHIAIALTPRSAAHIVAALSARQDVAALQRSVRRAVSYMEDAPELWGNPAVDAVIARLNAALGATADGETT